MSSSATDTPPVHPSDSLQLLQWWLDQVAHQQEYTQVSDAKANNNGVSQPALEQLLGWDSYAQQDSDPSKTLARHYQTLLERLAHLQQRQQNSWQLYPMVHNILHPQAARQSDVKVLSADPTAAPIAQNSNRSAGVVQVQQNALQVPSLDGIALLDGLQAVDAFVKNTAALRHWDNSLAQCVQQLQTLHHSGQPFNAAVLSEDQKNRALHLCVRAASVSRVTNWVKHMRTIEQLEQEHAVVLKCWVQAVNAHQVQSEQVRKSGQSNYSIVWDTQDIEQHWHSHWQRALDVCLHLDYQDPLSAKKLYEHVVQMHQSARQGAQQLRIRVKEKGASLSSDSKVTVCQDTYEHGAQQYVAHFERYVQWIGTVYALRLVHQWHGVYANALTSSKDELQAPLFEYHYYERAIDLLLEPLVSASDQQENSIPEPHLQLERSASVQKGDSGIVPVLLRSSAKVLVQLGRSGVFEKMHATHCKGLMQKWMDPKADPLASQEAQSALIQAQMLEQQRYLIGTLLGQSDPSVRYEQLWHISALEQLLRAQMQQQMQHWDWSVPAEQKKDGTHSAPLQQHAAWRTTALWGQLASAQRTDSVCAILALNASAPHVHLPKPISTVTSALLWLAVQEREHPLKTPWVRASQKDGKKYKEYAGHKAKRAVCTTVEHIQLQTWIDQSRQAAGRGTQPVVLWQSMSAQQLCALWSALGLLPYTEHTMPWALNMTHLVHASNAQRSNRLQLLWQAWEQHTSSATRMSCPDKATPLQGKFGLPFGLQHYGFYPYKNAQGNATVSAVHTAVLQQMHHPFARWCARFLHIDQQALGTDQWMSVQNNQGVQTKQGAWQRQRLAMDPALLTALMHGLTPPPAPQAQEAVQNDGHIKQHLKPIVQLPDAHEGESIHQQLKQMSLPAAKAHLLGCISAALEQSPSASKTPTLLPYNPALLALALLQCFGLPEQGHTLSALQAQCAALGLGASIWHQWSGFIQKFIPPKLLYTQLVHLMRTCHQSALWSQLVRQAPQLMEHIEHTLYEHIQNMSRVSNTDVLLLGSALQSHQAIRTLRRSPAVWQKSPLPLHPWWLQSFQTAGANDSGGTSSTGPAQERAMQQDATVRVPDAHQKGVASLSLVQQLKANEHHQKIHALVGAMQQALEYLDLTASASHAHPHADASHPHLYTHVQQIDTALSSPSALRAPKENVPQQGGNRAQGTPLSVCIEQLQGALHAALMDPKADTALGGHSSAYWSVQHQWQLASSKEHAVHAHDSVPWQHYLSAQVHTLSSADVRLLVLLDAQRIVDVLYLHQTLQNLMQCSFQKEQSSLSNGVVSSVLLYQMHQALVYWVSAPHGAVPYVYPTMLALQSMTTAVAPSLVPAAHVQSTQTPLTSPLNTMSHPDAVQSTPQITGTSVANPFERLAQHATLSAVLLQTAATMQTTVNQHGAQHALAWGIKGVNIDQYIMPNGSFLSPLIQQYQKLGRFGGRGALGNTAMVSGASGSIVEQFWGTQSAPALLVSDMLHLQRANSATLPCARLVHNRASVHQWGSALEPVHFEAYAKHLQALWMRQCLGSSSAQTQSANADGNKQTQAHDPTASVGVSKGIARRL